MKNVNTYLWVMATLLIFSCKKESTNAVLNVSGENAARSVVKEEKKWQGDFLSYNGFPDSRSVPDRLFIKNGYARIYSDSVHISNDNYYNTRFRLLVPASFDISGDSLNFEAGIKNPFNSAFYSPAFGRDITLYLRGETNEAFITNTATADIEAEAHKRAGVGIGGRLQFDMAGLQHNFEDYDTLILQTFNRGVKAYRNNEFLGGLGYEKEQNIGRLKEIGIIIKGSGYIDYIKVYNSVHGRLLMSEDFNTDGKSTIVLWR